MNALGPNVRLVLRGTEPQRLDAAVAALKQMIEDLGGDAEDVDINAG
jgi:hypothetical protein